MNTQLQETTRTNGQRADSGSRNVRLRTAAFIAVIGGDRRRHHDRRDDRRVGAGARLPAARHPLLSGDGAKRLRGVAPAGARNRRTDSCRDPGE